MGPDVADFFGSYEEGSELWLKTKISAFNYHLVNSHGGYGLEDINAPLSVCEPI